MSVLNVFPTKACCNVIVMIMIVCKAKALKTRAYLSIGKSAAIWNLRETGGVVGILRLIPLVLRYSLLKRMKLNLTKRLLVWFFFASPVSIFNIMGLAKQIKYLSTGRSTLNTLLINCF